MSRQINHEEPLSDVDRAYLKARGREGEIVHNDLLHGNAEKMSEEEIEEARQKEMIEAKGQRTPSLMDNSLIEEQQRQRADSEVNQLEAYADMTYGDYDPDDIVFIQSLSDDELREKLAERDLDATGTRPEMQKRLVDDMNAESSSVGDEGEDESEAGDNYDDKTAWSYQDLQDELKKRSLAANGSREELVARLRENNKQS